MIIIIMNDKMTAQFHDHKNSYYYFLKHHIILYLLFFHSAELVSHISKTETDLGNPYTVAYDCMLICLN